MSGNRVFVTGGRGYLGGRLLRDLPCAVPLEADVTDANAIKNALADAQADADRGGGAIVHLAAANEGQCAADLARGFLVNAVGAGHVLEAAAASGIPRVLFFSTFHVYAPPANGDVITEATVPVPTHPYGITKLAAEYVCRALAKRHGIDLAIVRLSNGVGAPAHEPISRWSLVLLDLCRQAQTARTLTLQTSGLQRRDFVSIDDVVDAVGRLLAVSSEELRQPVFNVGSGASMSIREMAILVQEQYALLYGEEIPLMAPDPAGDRPPSFRYDVTRMRALGFRPNTDLRQDVRRTLEFCERFRV